jgi:hypothetical protein
MEVVSHPGPQNLTTLRPTLTSGQLEGETNSAFVGVHFGGSLGLSPDDADGGTLRQTWC